MPENGIVRSELFSKDLRSKLESERDVFQGCKPRHRRTVIGGGQGEKRDLISGQAHEPPTDFPFLALRTGGGSALEGI
jgi:hypothetical protein